MNLKCKTMHRRCTHETHNTSKRYPEETRKNTANTPTVCIYIYSRHRSYTPEARRQKRSITSRTYHMRRGCWPQPRQWLHCSVK